MRVGKRDILRGNTTRVSRNADGWQPWMGIASYKAAEEAKEAALQLVDDLRDSDIVAHIKVT